ncbi:hypothetical protein JTE90_019761 [Oedothorax gibbosus]|uniref:Zinc finger matrin-type protein 5 n=1 Tax=Oedothorax gibbosus TaxID=931172 RepID=A0AAV6UQF5_9ARAC|nr:hypothetical protein JTE90_019761 [Oedothorax gibbosus]
MGKRYYCDYCERSFADGADNRKKHLSGVLHQKLRKAHYDGFKSASQILEENKIKRPCHKFHSGHCEYGNGCKYSHLTAVDVQNLQHQASLEQARKPLPNPDIDAWLKSKVLNFNKTTESTFTTKQTSLPPTLSTIPNLPPSLVPSKPSELLTAATLQWG